MCIQFPFNIFHFHPDGHHRYAHGVVPTVSKLVTAPIGHVKATPLTTGVKSVYSQHDEYYVSISDVFTSEQLVEHISMSIKNNIFGLKNEIII